MLLVGINYSLSTLQFPSGKTTVWGIDRLFARIIRVPVILLPHPAPALVFERRFSVGDWLLGHTSPLSYGMSATDPASARRTLSVHSVLHLN